MTAADSDGPDDAERAPDVTRAVTRGVARQFEDLGWAVVAEVALAKGRRADLIALASARITAGDQNARAQRCGRVFFPGFR